MRGLKPEISKLHFQLVPYWSDCRYRHQQWQKYQVEAEELYLTEEILHSDQEYPSSEVFRVRYSSTVVATTKQPSNKQWPHKWLYAQAMSHADLRLAERNAVEEYQSSTLENCCQGSNGWADCYISAGYIHWAKKQFWHSYNDSRTCSIWSQEAVANTDVS